jgi:uncharacterized membrane protein YdjX (TVP38/TMEM64 family)
MPSLLRASLLIALALLVPVLPFLILGPSYEESLVRWLAQDRSPTTQFAAIVVILSTDIFLPVPSSMVSTYGGGVLGTWLATAASWLGMTLGAAFGFALARTFGQRFAVRLAGSEDLERMTKLATRFGPLTILVTRALPLLAEACVLLMGATRLSWSRFLVPVVVGNLVVSLTYAACGDYFYNQDALLPAVVISGVVPLGFALAARRWLSRSPGEPAPNQSDG